MRKALAFIRILRPANAVMASAGAYLGFWLSGSAGWKVALLALASITAVGYGNVINDIHDLEADRINRPGRPLARGDMSVAVAGIYAGLLALLSLISGFLFSALHGWATLIPLILLSAYALRLKATPFAGNVLVSLLVAYPLIYGGLTGPRRTHLLAPALLALLLNLVREIVKDVQDRDGDRAAGIRTTGSLPPRLVQGAITVAGVIYIPCLFLPWYLGHFGWVYLGMAAASLSLHGFWLGLATKSDWVVNTGVVSMLVKVELALGLGALAADRIF